MNGWSVQATMSSAVGDGFALRVDAPGVGFSNYYFGVYVSATNTVRLVAGTSQSGAAGDPTYTVTTGGNLAVQILLDCDQPAAANGVTLAYYVGGNYAGSRTVSQTVGSYTFPAVMPHYLTTPHYLYRHGTVTSPSVTRWDNDASSTINTSVGSGWYRTDPFTILPPVGGQPFVKPDGEELLARPVLEADVASGENIRVWRRQGPGNAWTNVADLAAIGYYYASTVATVGYQVHGAEPPRAYLDFEYRSLDGFTTSDSTTESHRLYYNEPLTADGLRSPGDPAAVLMPTCIATSRADLCGLAVKYDYRDGREQVYVVPSWPWETITGGWTHGRYTVDAAVRTGGSYASRPHPWGYRGRDGRWRVGWFVNDAPAEYVSDDLFGTSWSAMSPTSDADAGYLNLVATNFWQGRDGRQAVAGYQFTEEKFVVLTRAGDGDPWTGPYLSVASSTAAAPYLYERPDGQWEVGWLIGGTWTRYTALRPGGTWSAV